MQSLESSCQEADYLDNEALQQFRRSSNNAMVDHSLSLIDHTDYTDASASSIITNPSISPPTTLVSLKHSHLPTHHLLTPTAQSLAAAANPPPATTASVGLSHSRHSTASSATTTATQHNSLNNNHINHNKHIRTAQHQQQPTQSKQCIQPNPTNSSIHHNHTTSPYVTLPATNHKQSTAQPQRAGDKRSHTASTGKTTAHSSSSSSNRGSPPKRAKNSSSSVNASSTSHHHYSSTAKSNSSSTSSSSNTTSVTAHNHHHNHHHHHSHSHHSQQSQQHNSNNNNNSTHQPQHNVPQSTFYDIHDRLRDIYGQLYIHDRYTSLQDPRVRQKSRSFALERLVERDCLNTVVLNLYAGNKGYSLAFRQDNSASTVNDRHASSAKHAQQYTSLAADDDDEENLLETMRWPYEVEGLLECIDNETLPMLFIDLLESRSPNVFYSGCVIMEVRDYRQSFEIAACCDTYFVLMKPTTQTLLADVNLIAAEADFSAEDKLVLESHLVLATAGPLCLDPNPEIGRLAINNQHKRQLWNTAPIRRQMKKFSQVSINRKRKTDQFTATPGMELHDHISRVRQKQRLQAEANGESLPLSAGIGRFTTRRTAVSNAAPPSDLMRPKRAPVLEYPVLAPPTEVNVEKKAKSFDKPREREDFMPQLVEEHVLETDRGGGRVYHIKLSIYQRPANSEFLGELYVDRDYKGSSGGSEGTYVMPSGPVPYLADIRADLRGADKERNGKACQFSLGTRMHATRYIQQFTDIFTEEGRKPVTVKLIVNGRVYDRTGKLDHHQQNWQQQQLQQQQHLVQQHHQLSSGVTPTPITLATGLSTTNVNHLPGNQNNHNNMQSSSSGSQYQYLSNSTIQSQQQQQQHLSNSVQSQNPNVVVAHNLPFIQQNAVTPNQSHHPPQQVVQHIYTTTNVDGSTGLQLQQQQLQNHQHQAHTNIQHPHQTQQHINLANGSVVVVQQQTGNIQRLHQHQSGGGLNNGATMRTVTSSVPVLQAHLQAAPQTQIHLQQQQQHQQQQQQQQHSTHLVQKPAPSPNSSDIIHSTNPEITALVTSFMNSANQFQQQAAAAAAAAAQQQQQLANASQKSSSSSNAAIISLLNSAPAAMTSSPVVNSTLSATNLNPTSLPPETLLNAPSPTVKQTTVPNNNAVTIQGIGGNNQNIVTSSGNLRKITMQQHQQIQQQHQQQQQQQTSRILNQNNLIAINAVGNIINPVHITNQDMGQQQQQQLQQQQQQLNVRVTMSALASQLASPPALMSNAVIQPQSFTFAQQPSVGQSSGQSALKQQLQLNSGVPQQILLNASATRNLLSQQQQQSQVLRRDSMTAPSPGSDSNASTTSSTTTNIAFSMPGLNALLATSPTTSHSGDGGPHSNISSSSSALMDRLTGGGGGGSASQQSVPSPSSTSSHFMSPSPKSTTPLLQQMHQINQAQSPASSISPMSSPPPQLQHQPTQTTTLNLQGINLSSLQGAIATFPHLQNVQVQIPGISQPISLSLTGAAGQALATASAAAVAQQQAANNQSNSTSVLVSVPTTSTTQVNHIQSVSAGGQHQLQQQLMHGGVGGSQSTQTVVLTNSTSAGGGSGGGQSSGSTMLSLPFAQLVAAGGVKGISQQSLQRTITSNNVQSTGNIQLVGTIQRPRSLGAQALINKQQQLNSQRIMVTQQHVQQQQQQQQQRGQTSMKLSASNSGGQVNNQHNTNSMVVTQQLQLKLQKQAQFQQNINNQTMGVVHQGQVQQQQPQQPQQQHQVLQQLQQQQQQHQQIHTIQSIQPQQQQQLHQQSTGSPTTMIIPSAGGVSGLIVQNANKQHRRGSATTEANK